MYLLLMSGYELGRFLSIMLWICVPGVIAILMATTWLHYRRRHKLQGVMLLSIEGLPAQGRPKEAGLPADEGVQSTASLVERQRVDDRVEELAPESGMQTEDEYKETLYKGILWMKEKYEQYRDLSDDRYERLREQLSKVEKRYEDLLASVTAGGAAGQGQAAEGTASQAPSQGHAASSQLEQQLAEKQRIIDDLENQLRSDRLKIDELVGKLKNNSQLLMNIYQELDKSIRYNETPGHA